MPEAVPAGEEASLAVDFLEADLVVVEEDAVAGRESEDEFLAHSEEDDPAREGGVTGS